MHQVKNYKDVKDLFILGDTSEVVTNLDDSLVTINTVLSSRYVGGIRGMVDEWRGKLVTLQVLVPYCFSTGHRLDLKRINSFKAPTR